MASFSFGQVEAILAAVNDIASDKRIAFGARLKHLQKQGIRAAGATPGRGKAAVHTFGELMQMALGVELLHFGVPPQKAAQLVSRNWLSLRYTVYIATFNEAEVAGWANEHQKKPPPTTWIWLVRAQALADLTRVGASEYDTYEAITAVALEDVATLLDQMGHSMDPDVRRSMLINGTSLSTTVMQVVTETFQLATNEELRAAIWEEFEEERKLFEGFTLSLKKDGDTIQPTPESASAVLEDLSPLAIAQLVKIYVDGASRLRFDPSYQAVMDELASHKLLAPNVTGEPDESAAGSLRLSRFGQWVAKFVYEGGWRISHVGS